MRALSKSAVGTLALLTYAHAQWLHYPSPGTPRTRDGKANLTAPTPRAPDGRPDLSGVWKIEPPPRGEIQKLLPGADFEAVSVPTDDPRDFNKYFFDILADFPRDQEPMTPDGAKRYREIIARGPVINTESHCLPMGVPRAGLITAPFKIIQAPKVTVILYEADNMHRQLYTDGRPLPPDPEPSWLGYSTGRWESGTLVVETAGLNDRARLDAFGHPRSESMHLTERFRRRDFGHMEIAITFNDPVNYTRPFTIRYNVHLQPDTDVLENICNENEKDLRHLGEQ